MSKGIVKLCYRKIIDINSSKTWEKLVFEDTYTEYRLQAQTIDLAKQWNTFSDLQRNVPGADRLHFLVSAAAIGYLKQLNGTIPDITNNLGRLFLKFSNYQFEVINSDLHDKSKHRIAISFFSDEMTWHDTVANYLLLSDINATDPEELTHLLSLQPFLSIHSLR